MCVCVYIYIYTYIYMYIYIYQWISNFNLMESSGRLLKTSITGPHSQNF